MYWLRERQRGMCQSENATQPHTFASTVSGNQQDVRLVCQMLPAKGGCSNTWINLLFGLYVLQIGLEVQRTALSFSFAER